MAEKRKLSTQECFIINLATVLNGGNDGGIKALLEDKKYADALFSFRSLLTHAFKDGTPECLKSSSGEEIKGMTTAIINDVTNGNDDKKVEIMDDGFLYLKDNNKITIVWAGDLSEGPDNKLLFFSTDSSEQIQEKLICHDSCHEKGRYLESTIPIGESSLRFFTYRYFNQFDHVVTRYIYNQIGASKGGMGGKHRTFAKRVKEFLAE